MKRNLSFVFFVIAMALLFISCGATAHSCTSVEKDITNPTLTQVTVIETIVTE